MSLSPLAAPLCTAGSKLYLMYLFNCSISSFKVHISTYLIYVYVHCTAEDSLLIPNSV